jgi:hypothetical protein
MLSPLEVNRGMLHLMRCAPTKPPGPLRASAPPRPTTTPCNAEETQGAQSLLFNIRLVLPRRPTSLPMRDYGDVHFLPRPLRFSPDRARDAET